MILNINNQFFTNFAKAVKNVKMPKKNKIYNFEKSLFSKNAKNHRIKNNFSKFKNKISVGISLKQYFNNFDIVLLTASGRAVK